MANPYHDEAGKFASRDEMAGAIQRLAGSGNFEAALALQQEMAEVDTQQAKESEAFYKGALRTVAADSAFRSNQKPHSGYGYRNKATPMRDFTNIFSSATDGEQLNDAIQLAGVYAYVNPNASAAFNSPGATPALRADLLAGANESDGRWTPEDHTRSELLTLAAKLPESEREAIYAEGAASVRGGLFDTFSDEAAVRLVQKYPSDTIPLFARAERKYDPALRDSFIRYTEADDEGEQRFLSSDVADYVAEHDASNEAFEFALGYNDQDTLAAAGSNSAINTERAKALVAKANEYNLNNSLRTNLLENPATPLTVKQALNAEPKPFGDEATEAELAKIADLKAKAAKWDGVWISPNNTGDWQKARQYGRKAEKLLTKADAAPMAFAKLSKRWETLQSNFAKSSSRKPSKVYQSVKERYENAVDYQRAHTVREAVANLA